LEAYVVEVAPNRKTTPFSSFEATSCSMFLGKCGFVPKEGNIIIHLKKHDMIYE